MVHSKKMHRCHTDNSTRTKKVPKADAGMFLDLNKITPAEKKTF
jgi:hypothetical protein